MKVASAAYHALARYGLEKLALGPAGWGGLVGAVGGGIYGYTREPDDDHLGRRLVRTGLGVAGGGAAGLVAGGILSGGKALRDLFRDEKAERAKLKNVLNAVRDADHAIATAGPTPHPSVEPPASSTSPAPSVKTRYITTLWEMNIQKQVPGHLRDEYTRRVHHSDSVVDPVATFRELTGKDPTAHPWISPELSPGQLQEMWRAHKQKRIDLTASILRGESVEH